MLVLIHRMKALFSHCCHIAPKSVCTEFFVEDSHSLLFVQVHLFSEPWKPSQQPLASGSIAFASLKEGQDVKVYMLWTLRTHAAEVI